MQPSHNPPLLRPLAWYVGRSKRQRRAWPLQLQPEEKTHVKCFKCEKNRKRSHCSLQRYVLGTCKFLRWQVCVLPSSAGLQGRSLKRSSQRSQFIPAVLCLQSHRGFTCKSEQKHFKASSKVQPSLKAQQLTFRNEQAELHSVLLLPHVRTFSCVCVPARSLEQHCFACLADSGWHDRDTCSCPSSSSL